ncbi:MAG: PTS alpha-glucoside transporter subunit IIA, partial [Streptomyces sp.]|nr:PTS alpha-glucoside transporter subunit IIA [Streptomyces sp.]
GSTAIGPSGWALFPLLDGDRGLGEVVTVYAAGLLVGYVGGFLATYYFGFTRTMLAELNVAPAPAAPAAGGAPANHAAPEGVPSRLR